MDSAEFLDLLGNANRRRILRLLAQEPCYVTEISERLGVSPKAVIDHLGKLEEAGLIESRTDDRRRKYFSIARHVSLEVTVSPYEFGTRSAYPSSSRFDVTSCRQVSIELESLVTHEDGEHDERASASGRETTAEDARKPPGDDASTADAATGDAHPPGDDAPAGTAGDDGRAGAAAGELQSTTGDSTAALARQLREFQQLERELSLVHRWAEGRITELREQLGERVDVADPRLVSTALVALAEEPHRTEALCRRLGVPPAVGEELLELLAEEGIVRRDGRRWMLVD